MTKKRYQNVSKLMADVLPDDLDFVDELEEQIDNRRLVRGLARLRNVKRVSQAQVAEKLDCTQGRISKLENGVDANLKVGDIEAYAEALGCDVQVVFRIREFSLVDEVKYHASHIHRCFEKLTDLAKKDEDVSKGVADFHIEALLNLANIVQQSAKKLPKRIIPHLQLAVPDVELSRREQMNRAESNRKIEQAVG